MWKNGLSRERISRLLGLLTAWLEIADLSLERGIRAIIFLAFGENWNSSGVLFGESSGTILTTLLPL